MIDMSPKLPNQITKIKPNSKMLICNYHVEI